MKVTLRPDLPADLPHRLLVSNWLIRHEKNAVYQAVLDKILDVEMLRTALESSAFRYLTALDMGDLTVPARHHAEQASASALYMKTMAGSLRYAIAAALSESPEAT